MSHWLNKIGATLINAGLIAIPLAWYGATILSDRPIPVILEMQGPKGGLVELRWGNGLTDSIVLWPGELIAGPHQLQVISTGQKNEHSQDTQVWITNINYDNGRQIPFDFLQLTDGWGIEDNRLYSRQNPTEPLILAGTATNVSLQLVKNAQSGQIIIRWDDREKIYDLYSPTTESIAVQLDGVRRWHGKLPHPNLNPFWLQFRQGIEEGTLIRLRIETDPPQEWSGDRLAELIKHNPEVITTETNDGLQFSMTQPEIEIDTEQPWARPLNRPKFTQIAYLWLIITPILAIVVLLAGAWLQQSRIGEWVRTKKFQQTRFMKAGILLSINFMILILLLYGFEHYLRLTDPFLNKLPFDSAYYYQNRLYYESLDLPQNTIVFPWGGSSWYTWGHFVVNNSLGFREREISPPKPANLCRIMVLGDSFTWGQGVAVEQRYTDLTETYLSHTFPDKRFEVLSFGLPSAPTTQERDFFQNYKNLLNPDLVVVGFVSNDPQPINYTTEETQMFNEKYGDILNSITHKLVQLGLPQTARIFRKASYNFTVMVGTIPHWEVGLSRTYEQDSTEWIEFKQALKDIKTMSDEMNLPPPLFAVLNYTMEIDHPTNYQNQDETLPLQLQWNHQAERTALKIGFRTYNHEKELLAQLKLEELPVNELDNHPSAKVHQIYAQKLSEIIVFDIRNGRLCNQPK